MWHHIRNQVILSKLQNLNLEEIKYQILQSDSIMFTIKRHDQMEKKYIDILMVISIKRYRWDKQSIRLIKLPKPMFRHMNTDLLDQNQVLAMKKLIKWRMVIRYYYMKENTLKNYIKNRKFYW